MKRLHCLFLLLFLPATAPAELNITVTGGEVAALPIAIVPFGGQELVKDHLSGIVSSDLARSGRFRTVSPGDMLEHPTRIGDVDYRNWRAIGVDNVAIGQIGRAGGGGLSVRVKLLDVLQGREMVTYEVPIPDPQRARAVAHELADLIYERLTGIPGYFRSQIVYRAVTGAPGRELHQIVVADSDGYNPVTVASSREPLMSPAWSPDGRRLAYVGFERGRSAIYIHELATGELRQLVAERGINGAPAWSPDGRKLAVTLSFEVNSDIYVIDLDTGKRRQLTRDFAIDTESAWSPDGREIVFTSDRGGSPQIYAIGAEGGTPRRITFEGRQNARPQFSPDGRLLTLVNLGERGYRIGLLDYATRELRLLSEGPNDESPSFAPNGDVVIYAAQSRGDLATVTVDGRVRQRLHQPGDTYEPAWSPVAR